MTRSERLAREIFTVIRVLRGTSDEQSVHMARQRDVESRARRGARTVTRTRASMPRVQYTCTKTSEEHNLSITYARFPLSVRLSNAFLSANLVVFYAMTNTARLGPGPSGTKSRLARECKRPRRQALIGHRAGPRVVASFQVLGVSQFARPLRGAHLVAVQPLADTVLCADVGVFFALRRLR